MTWTAEQQRRLDELLDKEVNGGGLPLNESLECRGLERQRDRVREISRHQQAVETYGAFRANGYM
jgi:hypothetical protein